LRTIPVHPADIHPDNIQNLLCCYIHEGKHEAGLTGGLLLPHRPWHRSLGKSRRLFESQEDLIDAPPLLLPQEEYGLSVRCIQTLAVFFPKECQGLPVGFELQAFCGSQLPHLAQLLRVESQSTGHLCLFKVLGRARHLVRAYFTLRFGCQQWFRWQTTDCQHRHDQQDVIALIGNLFIATPSFLGLNWIVACLTPCHSY